MKASDLHKLAAEFPRDEIHWRTQTLTKKGDKALALAYLDARDVMERLDQVCGPAGWQTRHQDMGGGKLSCEIGILIDGEWIWKSDGAGATDVEGDKGAFSDSLKRAAVSWGIGRYLYDLGNTWVPCKTYTNAAGKVVFDSFTDDPWNYVKNTGKATWHGPLGKMELKDEMKRLADKMNGQTLVTTGDLERLEEEYSEIIAQALRDLPDWWRGYDVSKRRLLSTLQVGQATPNADDPSSYQGAVE